MVEYDSETKEGKCIFCEIAKGNMNPLGNGTIYEDDKYMAWLSPFPNTKGVVLVIPKKHFSSDILAMNNIDFTDLILKSKEIGKFLENYFDDVGRVGLIMEGTGIDHAHVKLFPMHDTIHMKKGEWKQYHSGIDTYIKSYTGHISSHDGPKADFIELEKLAISIKEFIKNNN